MEKPNSIWYKILSHNGIHYNHQYTDGLNILKDEFNDNENDPCGGGGFYFTTLEHISNFYHFGCYLTEVFLPIDDADFKMVKSNHGNKWRANKIIIGKKHLLDNKIKTLINYANKCKNKILDFDIPDNQLYNLDLDPDEISTIMSQTGATYEWAINALRITGNVVDAILSFIDY